MQLKASIELLSWLFVGRCEKLEVYGSLPAAVRRATCYSREVWRVNTYTYVVSLKTLA